MNFDFGLSFACLRKRERESAPDWEDVLFKS
jgi:hypothetical protein